ncbi:hypothetical protein ACIP98_35240 [Streptomyces sp. NPDC088354]|uniref:hypothetical protein n=1 Tax=Streptomyces sp. NPDC088354 TaxID=3365856 RepID=UPI0038186053
MIDESGAPAQTVADWLEARDRIAETAPHPPERAASPLLLAPHEMDDVFAGSTVDDPGRVLVRELAGDDRDRGGRGWWWNRRPDPLPWHDA